MHIRPSRTSDLPALVGLTIEVFGPFYEQSFRAMVPPDVYEHQHGRWADDYRDFVPTLHDPEHGKHVAVAESDDGQIVAYVGWHIDLERRHGEIDPLAVRETHRRSGLGRELCEHAISAMREHGVEVVSVGTGGDWFHAPARALYESMDFYPVPVVYYLRAL
ncbi:MAG TPA: GNAT family N-acetyltransferase [Nocardioidaceae bacterium]|nr:GNAT family N-acetyltransferase [Nocardioidaceae bacterium]